MKNHRIISETNREYSIIHDPHLDINIIMDTMLTESTSDNEILKFKFVDYVHGNPKHLKDKDFMYYILRYEKKQ